MSRCLEADTKPQNIESDRFASGTTCLRHKDEGIPVPLNALLMDTTSKLAGKLTVPVVMIK